jgi:thiol-disulfide isomerase/thioredoxin
MSMLKARVLYCIIVILLLPFNVLCNNMDTSHQNPTTILIFDHIPPYVRSTFPLPRLEHKDDRFQVTIFDNFYAYTFNPKPSTRDTIVFYQKNEHIVLTFLYSMTREPLNYVINKGDTITFSFIKDRPYVKKNEISKNDYLNYDYDRLLANKNTQQPTSYEIYKNPSLVAKDINDLVNNRHEIERNYYNQARHFLNNELSFLNNFKELRGKAPDLFIFFQDKLTYQIARLDFEQHRLSADSLNAILALNKQRPVKSSYSYFLPFLERVSDSVIVKKAKFLKYENGSDIDYRDVYDRTNNWSAINDFYKKQLLYKYLKKIGEIFSVSDLQAYLSKFASFSNDTVLVQNIRNEFLISNDPGTLSKDSLYMADAKNNKLSLQTFLNVNKGKLIYIDFWASWCVPCRREMKNADKLREAFKGKDVVFVYFSVDKSKEAWIEASNEERLNAVQHNYILTNAESSAFLKSIDFGPIPRYLLYDKSGKLVHKNAPPPSSEESHRLLTDYLVK